ACGHAAPSPLSGEAEALLEEAQAIARAVIEAPAGEGAALAAVTGRLRAMHAALGVLSDGIGRRYFALLPTPHSVGAAVEATRLRGAA
nr:hypothetical protein [Rhodospirillales bacterium]